ncbi:hypothetical protein Baya_12227 [Bagarius yarrelli]|uniref:Uncharacterized protein n=1 Tax=Bagarius yarrelli TaxID=175774 RepID=A0A556V2R3_BAGYA|nr:hypothetical protein Baya_12227 [Bagarius yarrelli]
MSSEAHSRDHGRATLQGCHALPLSFSGLSAVNACNWVCDNIKLAAEVRWLRKQEAQQNNFKPNLEAELWQHGEEGKKEGGGRQPYGSGEADGAVRQAVRIPWLLSITHVTIEPARRKTTGVHEALISTVSGLHEKDSWPFGLGFPHPPKQQGVGSTGQNRAIEGLGGLAWQCLLITFPCPGPVSMLPRSDMPAFHAYDTTAAQYRHLTFHTLDVLIH